MQLSANVSQLRATLPVSIFISPNLPIDDDNNLVDQTPRSAQRAIETIAQQAPPLYGDHQFDQLYSEVDLSGYRTPGPASGRETPFGSMSRNLSSENLPSMNALTTSDISASALHSRLSNLHATGHNHPSPPELDDPRRLGLPTDYFGRASGSHSPVTPGLSRRPSDEAVDHDHTPSGAATPFRPQFTEVETLSRVPSYSTAVRTTVRPCDSELPDYQAVVSSHSAIPTPQQAHVRTGVRGPGARSSLIDVLHRPGLSHLRSTSHADDEERSLRLTQARAQV